MSTYDKKIAISHEQEGTYHRREVSPARDSHRPQITYHTERRLVPADSSSSRKSSTNKTSRQLAKASAYSSDEDDNNYDEWTTSKRKINHTTRQVETRVSRQLLVEDGKVIADSGPQVTTKIKEDNKVEECAKEKAPKNKKGFEALECAPESGESSGRVLGEKKEIQRVSHEVREENMQYHDERFKELSGKDVHRRAVKAPNELLTIEDEHERHSKGPPRGKMVHYSNKGKKFEDTDEILEVAKLAIDGSVTKEVKRTRHHVEFSDDEKPDEKGEAEALRRKPIVERSSRRHVDYVNDFDDTNTPETSDVEPHHHHHHHQADDRVRAQKSGRTSSSRKRDRSDEAFPRYQIDPLLNSLRDEDFRPPVAEGRARPIVRRDESASSSDEDPRQQARHKTSAGSPSGGRVEIPEEYRVNRQRLMHSSPSSPGRRSHSPQTGSIGRNRTSTSRAHNKHSASRREDASVQARLTDEEEESRSHNSELNSHEKTRYLQCQSAPNATRQYYYGESKPKKEHSRRRNSLTSSSSSSSSLDHFEKAAKTRSQSRDSGFRSPAQRAQTPSSQIYSVSEKSKSRQRDQKRVASPTPSAGQRSVKTTTTTLSAGLKERPLSPEHQVDESDCLEAAEERQEPNRPVRKSKTSHRHQEDRRRQQQTSTKVDSRADQTLAERSDSETHNSDYPDDNEPRRRKTNETVERRQRRQSIDSVSVSSLKGPYATTIKVPYTRISAIEQTREMKRDNDQTKSANNNLAPNASGSEMSLQEDIENLRKRLANIRESDGKRTKNFDYKTIVANIRAAPNNMEPRKQHVIDAYNVQVIEQNSPFIVGQSLRSTAQKGSEEAATSFKQAQNTDNSIGPALSTENNNISGFNLDQFNFKYRAVPALVEPNVLLAPPELHMNDKSGNEEDDNDDRLSQSSSCSLQSSKTYNIRKVCHDLEDNKQAVEQTMSRDEAKENHLDSPEVAEDPLTGKNPAWIFDPRDHSTTAIAPPPKPKKPPTPEVQTEELVQAPGGRSYYLELVDRDGNKLESGDDDEKQDSSIYSHWKSQGALNTRETSCGFINWSQVGTDRAQRALNSTKSVERQPEKPTSTGVAPPKDTNQRRFSKLPSAASKQQVPRAQLPYAGPPISLLNRSKSSSCLLSVTKPSKYSIYGGFRKPGETNKPVPRLSYSRAIGPRSQRQTKEVLPSRYLKMK